MHIYHVDAFSSVAFSGNPAGVCPLEAPAPEEWMQQLAAEVNASETAFTHPLADGSYRLRWFTPTSEVDLCGHATLAAAHVINSAEHYPGRTVRLTPDERIRFSTNSGKLSAVVTETGITLDFPATPASAIPAPTSLARALGGTVPTWTGTSQFDLLVELADCDAVRSVAPDFNALTAMPYRGVIVTAAAEPSSDADFISRFFAPNVGVPEDPVTGSSHCTLAPFWTQRLGRKRLLGHQASQRGGYVGVELRGNRVGLHGQAITVFTSELATVAAPANTNFYNQ